MAFLTQEQVAEILSVTTRRVRQLEEEENAPHRSADGKYPCKEFGEWQRRRILSELGVADNGKAYDYNAEKARLTKAQADKTELEVKEIQGEVIRLPLVEKHWQAMISSMRAKLLSLPTKAAAQISPPDKLQSATDILQSLIYEALFEIAGDAIPNDVRDRIAAQARAESEVDSKAAA